MLDNNYRYIKDKLADLDFDTKPILKQLVKSNTALAELKGIAAIIPNQSILINTLIIREAKDSSAIENIVTTHDHLYKAEVEVDKEKFKSLATKEVQNYNAALKKGFSLIQKNTLLTNKTILTIQETLERNDAGYRKVPGTNLRNEREEVIYTPPQNHSLIVELMNDLELFINADNSEIDPIVKMAIIHFQFETIHPFYDGNGRTGRIINILYLILQDLLKLPILYLSSYIIKHKSDYYRLIQEVRDKNNWEEWILFILKGVEETAKESVILINSIWILMKEFKRKLRDEFKYKFYSQDLINHLFKHPYTKIDFLMSDMNISRPTASIYLNTLAKDKFLVKRKIGNTNYYINDPLYKILT